MTDLAVLTVGPLSWEMGLEYALSAVAKLRGRGIDVRYDIIGQGGSERDRVVYTAFDLGISDIVSVHGPDTPFPGADVFLWPHLLGMRPPEFAGGLGRVVGPGVSVRDVDALADAIAGTR
jgi:glycosyltransferase involved in cell wall biosynthesis